MTELENNESPYKCRIFYVLHRLDFTLTQSIGTSLYRMPTMNTTVSCANQIPSEGMDSITVS